MKKKLDILEPSCAFLNTSCLFLNMSIEVCFVSWLITLSGINGDIDDNDYMNIYDT